MMFFVGNTFCFPCIMLMAGLKSTGCTNWALVFCCALFVQGFCSTLHGANLFAISERSMKPLASWELAIQKKSFQKRVTCWSWWFSQLPCWTMEYVLSIPWRLQTKPNETKFPAMTFSSTHWKNTLDLWTNERRLCLYNLKITWLNCKAMKRQALNCRYLLGGVFPAPKKFNIDIHNKHIFKGDTCSKTIIFGYPFGKS